MAKDADIYVAKETFSCDLDGATVVLHKGVTRVRAGHPILKGREHLFEPIDLSVHYEVEQATAAPGEKRKRSRRKPKAKAAASKKPEKASTSKRGGK